MKNLIKLIAFLIPLSLFSQVVISNENIDETKDYNNAVLTLDGNLGFLPPVMTEEQRDKIPVDASSEGLLIYSLTSKSLNIYDGEKWNVIKPQFKSVGTSTICPKERNQRELLHCLQSNYSVKNSLGYDKARDVIYGEIDLNENKELEGIYTGYKIVMNYETSNDPSTEAFHKGINAEHLFPQSMGAKEEPNRSDMYHIFPAKSNVNSSRNNCPHQEIPDNLTDTWYIDDTALKNIPTSNIDGYSEKKNTMLFPTLSSKQQCAFEPRESKKGDIARALFYFYTIYNKNNVNKYKIYANDAFFEVMRKDLLQWDKKDPIDDYEKEREKKVKSYQKNDNPFILDPELGQRLFR